MGFRVWATMDQRLPLSRVATHALRVEQLGYEGLVVPESVHDGLAAATVALQATTRLCVATSVLVAFPRSPTVTALAAFDLQEMSGGRFELGLGSQVRGNIVGRYGTPWSAPVPRMREYVRAIRAIWTCWQEGGDLDVSGEHYRIDLMQPFFRPDPIEGPLPKIHLGAVGPAMTTLAGEVADGLMTHPTNTAPRYLEQIVRPRMAAGAARAARDATRLDLLVGPLVATGPDAASVDEARREIRQLLGFLYSTPAYWPSLEMFGWRERGERLHALSRERRWPEMPAVVDDEMLDQFAPSAPYAEIADLLTERFRGLTDWITFPVPVDPARDATARRAITALSEGIAE